MLLCEGSYALIRVCCDHNNRNCAQFSYDLLMHSSGCIDRHQMEILIVHLQAYKPTPQNNTSPLTKKCPQISQVYKSIPQGYEVISSVLGLTRQSFSRRTRGKSSLYLSARQQDRNVRVISVDFRFLFMPLPSPLPLHFIQPSFRRPLDVSSA